MLLKILFLFLLLSLSQEAFAQDVQAQKLEQSLRSLAISNNLKKKVTDLNKDGRPDLIFTYRAGEPLTIRVFLNQGRSYEECLHESGEYALATVGGQKQLTLTLEHCCGESPYFSTRVFSFGKTGAKLLQSYVLTNNAYTGTIPFIRPAKYLLKSYFVTIAIDAYNLRFSPSIAPLTAVETESFEWACEDSTNIIARLKKGSRALVLSELQEANRRWLFVEVETGALAGNCNPVDFEFAGQKLRGWISGRFVQQL